MSLHENFAPLSHSALLGFEQASAKRGYAHGVAKRVLDLVIAVPLLIALAPVLMLLAVIVRAGSKGPALFRQTRLGLNGAPFHILKFRTMTVMEDGASVKQAVQGDARVTSCGVWMRKLSFDELPQLINVINGDMSLIGPRPHALAHDRYYGSVIANYNQRQSVKPGISGWAQVNGLRGATETVKIMRRRVSFDIWYAQHASFGLDILILFRTFAEVLRQRNAH